MAGRINIIDIHSGWIREIHRIVGTIEVWRQPVVLLTQGVRLCKEGHCRIVLSRSEVVLVQAVGRYQLLAAEPVRLAGYLAGAEVGDDSSIWIVRDRLLDGSCRAVDDGAVVAKVVTGYTIRSNINMSFIRFTV